LNDRDWNSEVGMGKSEKKKLEIEIWKFSIDPLPSTFNLSVSSYYYFALIFQL